MDKKAQLKIAQDYVQICKKVCDYGNQEINIANERKKLEPLSLNQAKQQSSKILMIGTTG